MRTQISVEDASLQLGISKQQVRTLCRQAKITAKKIGNTWIIEQKSVNEIYQQNSKKWQWENHTI
jgi:DNA (cytosine-5)-methyltransferase 1